MATIKQRIDSITENVTDGKQDIASAITDKGVTTSSSATFSTMANNIRAIEAGAKDRIQNEADSSYVYVKSDDTIEADCSDCNIHASSYLTLTGEVGSLAIGDVIEFDNSPVTFLRGLYSYDDAYLNMNGTRTYMGSNIQCNNSYETGIGNYNISRTGDSATTFTVGTGTSSSNRRNAIEVRKNGDVRLGLDKTYIDFIASNQDGQQGLRINCGDTVEGISIIGGNNAVYDANFHMFIGRRVNDDIDTTVDVRGDIRATGTITPGSDRKLKENIRPLEDDTLNKVLQLKPTRFTLKNDESKKEQIGFIAQEVEEVFPEFVVSLIDKDKEETKYLDYMKLTSILCKAIQEQQKKIEELEAKIS